ncbi:alpha-mannosidase [Streptomyces sp. CBMA29]|uniref:alpha-mannosidase n=1 Tax=Streptomyces sp. CBMA29 TaxID=1896314 RepID=UPI00166197DC|nr:glycoside hydrolase family 38 C-terminal domain-containing protein [Streptomyces sp. CBMA29]MBD0736654.1 alpha-mannosidase [Streptomyces sp. CBMA29]
MHDRMKSGEERIAAFLAERLRPALYPQKLPMDVGAWHIAGEPVPAEVALRADYAPFAVGEAWGRPWATTWFSVHATVPERWAGRRVEALFDLGSGPGDRTWTGAGGGDGTGDGTGAGAFVGPAEGLVHDAHGIPLQGLRPGLGAVLIAGSATGGSSVRLLVEAAANPHIAAGSGAGTRYGDPATAGDTLLYRLRRADLAVRDEDVWQLIHDVHTLEGLMRALPEQQPRRHEIRLALERALDAVDPRAVGRTAGYARTLLTGVLARRAHESAHTVTAVGHAHTGSARLWPVRETVRKCARAFSTMAALADEYPELVVAASSAQHYAWMKDHQPHVFERIRKAVADGNWAPVGGMWVEADTELPGGEALVRQLVHGRRFFRDELGTETDGVWLPGASGASAAFPQLAALAGARWFLGRRPEPGRGSALPHHTFRWEGLDGTRLFAHLAPAGTDSDHGTEGQALTGGDLVRSVDGFADKGHATRSLLPFGRGDGGPDRSMLERARRLADLDGAPRVALGAPARFFRDAQAEYPAAPVWRGELDLAPHLGTYTSQARTKRGNRRSEALLHEAELWSATAAVRHAIPYPYEELERLWKKVLLQQCHDILPGTSIAWAHEEAEQTHRDVTRRLERLIRRAVGDPDGATVLNAGPRARREVVVLAPEDGPAPGTLQTGTLQTGTFPTGAAQPGTAQSGTAQPLSDGRFAVLAQAPAHGSGPAGIALGDLAPVTVTAGSDGGHVLDNGLLRIRVDAAGLVRSAADLGAGREAIAPGAAGNLLQLHRDEPGGWSAARYAPAAGSRDLDRADQVEVTAAGPLLARLRILRGTGRSTVVQELTLTAGSHALTVDTEVDWREQDTVLKAAWPLDVHAEHSRAETQFGHVARPTHENTDGDAARQESVAHRWIHVGEHGWGVALAGDSTYGYDVTRHTRADGGTTTVVRSTLLRAPRSPDPHADRGLQRFRHRLRPGADVDDAICEGYALHLPLRPGPVGGADPLPGTASDVASTTPLVAVDHPDVVVETVKLADDRSGDVVVRLYESRGGRARAVLTAGFPATAVQETDLLEERLADHPHDDGRTPLTLRPFQVLTLRLVRPREGQEGRVA